MKNLIILIHLFLTAILLSCNSKPIADDAEEGKDPKSKTPVIISSVSMAPISESIQLNAVSSFIGKNEVRSISVGYLNKIHVQFGDPVHKGQILFDIKTKEASALGNNLFPKDTSLQFSGILHIRASQDGFVTSIHHQIGDFVQEGDSLCTIVNRNSLVFMINVPFEWSRYVHIGMHCSIKLPDGRTVPGTLYQKVSIMDLSSQTQNYMVKIDKQENLPENLIAKVEISKENKKSTLSVLKSAILANEEETQFWVMKVVHDTLAVKVNIQKGIENSERVELLGNTLKPGDPVIISGNYGLPDSSTVFIQK